MDNENENENQKPKFTEEQYQILQNTNQENIDRISILEKEAKNAFSKRDKLKDDLHKLEEKKTSDNDNEFKNLQQELEKVVTERNSAQENFSTYKKTQALKNAIQTAGVEADVANPAMFDIVTSMLEKEAHVNETGDIVYQNSDGTTAYNNGKIVTIKDKLQEIKNDINYAGLFKPQVSGGSGSKESKGSSTQTGDLSKMNIAEKAQLMKELGSEKYLELSRKQMNQ